MELPAEYAFLKDPSLDADAKKALLQALLEEKKFARDAPLERKRFWHNTPLMLALVGTITIAANGIVSYVQAFRTTSDTVTLEQLKSQLKDSEARSSSARASEASEADAKRTASKEEREFAFKIIEKELAKTGDSSSRAEILLFLARAGILNSLNRAELEQMALRDIAKAGKGPGDVGIPPTLGRKEPPVVPLETVSFAKVLLMQAASYDKPGHVELKLEDCSDILVKADFTTIATKLPDQSKFARLGGWGNAQMWMRRDAIDLPGSGDEPDGYTRILLRYGDCMTGYSSKHATWQADVRALLKSLPK